MSDEEKQKLQMDHEKMTFIREQIAPDRHSTLKKYMVLIGRTSLLAVVFGLIGGLAFSVAHSSFSSYLNKNAKDPISFSDTKESPEPSITPEPSAEPVSTPESTPIEKEEKDPMEDYMLFCKEMTAVADEFNQSVVTVTGIKSGVDWFDNPAVAASETSGIIIADNDAEYLILVNYDEIEAAENIEVTFQAGTNKKAKLISRDTDLNLAILAISRTELSKKEQETVKAAMLADSYYAQTGTPVLALGSPDGYVYSMELGTITSRQIKQDITDGEVELFSTDMGRNADGDGVIVDTEGKILGIITHQFDKNIKNDSCTAVSINRIKPMITKMINKESRVYLGITASDIPDEYKEKLKVEQGIYVTDVKSDSPALDGGIQVGDIITEINGFPVNTVSGYMSYLEDFAPKDKISIKVMRTSKKGNPVRDVSVTAASR